MKRLIKDGVYTDAGNDISAEFKSNMIVLLRGYLDKYDAIDVEHILVNTLRGMCSMERLKFTNGTDSMKIKSKPLFANDEEYREFMKEHAKLQREHSEEVENRRKNAMAHKIMLSARQSGKTELQTYGMESATSAYVNQDGCVKDQCEKGKCKTCLDKNLQELHDSIGKHISTETSYVSDNFQDVIDDILWDKRKPSHVVMDECQNMDKSQWVKVGATKLDIFKDTLKEKI